MRTDLQLTELIKNVPSGSRIDVEGDCGQIEISSITDDSRCAGSGILFAATPQGESYLEQAIQNRPAALLLTAEMRERSKVRALLCKTAPLPILTCDSPPRLVGEWSALLRGDPSGALTLIGITGTNGKTTIAGMLFHIWRSQGKRPGSIGTLGVRWIDRSGGEKTAKTGYTTPRAPELQDLLARMRDDGVTHVCLEASSEGLSLGRLEGCRFAAAVFTNLTRDHLDHHQTMENYYAAKAKLFEKTAAQGGRLIIHSADEYGGRLARRFRDYEALELLESPFVEDLPAPTIFNRLNASLAVLASSSEAELRLQAARSLSGLPEIPGRFNVVLPPFESLPFRPPRAEGGDPESLTTRCYGVIDYAHTPHALENILREVRDIGARSLVCVVGCGGNRDATKRIPMGRIAVRHSDLVVVTDDNPRNEEPGPIREAIIRGAREEIGTLTNREVLEIGDRREAIVRAVRWAFDRFRYVPPSGREEVAGTGSFPLARAGESPYLPVAVVVAGKGHEEEQLIADRRIHFSDREELEAAFTTLSKMFRLTESDGAQS